MTHKTTIKKISNLRHITYARTGFLIAQHGFWSNFDLGHYDAGANFLGVLGEQDNTHPEGKGATLFCTWDGEVSDPLPYDSYHTDKPNVLYDFNGSGPHFENQDPRYFLPYGSKGLILNRIDFDSEEALLYGYCYLRGAPYSDLYERGERHDAMLAEAKAYRDKLNAQCNDGKIMLSVNRGRAPQPAALSFWQRSLAVLKLSWA